MDNFVKDFRVNKVFDETIKFFSLQIIWHLRADHVRCPVTSAADGIECQVRWAFIYPSHNVGSYRSPGARNEHATRSRVWKYANIMTNGLPFIIYVNLFVTKNALLFLNTDVRSVIILESMIFGKRLNYLPYYLTGIGRSYQLI